MKNVTIKTERELKAFLNTNRKSLVNINGVECGPLYPMIEVTNKHANYYSQDKQDTVILFPPFILKLIISATHKIISRTTGLTEFEGSYSECNLYMDKNADTSLFGIDEPTHDEDGNYNAIRSN